MDEIATQGKTSCMLSGIHQKEMYNLYVTKSRANMPIIWTIIQKVVETFRMCVNVAITIKSTRLPVTVCLIENMNNITIWNVSIHMDEKLFHGYIDHR